MLYYLIEKIFCIQYFLFAPPTLFLQYYQHMLYHIIGFTREIQSAVKFFLRKWCIEPPVPKKTISEVEY